MQELYHIIKHLTVLVQEFSKRFTKHKQAEGILDFLDLEQYSLELLIDEDSPYDQPKQSKETEQLKDQYTEVHVDEYQDMNLVQEQNLPMLSDDTGKDMR